MLKRWFNFSSKGIGNGSAGGGDVPEENERPSPPVREGSGGALPSETRADLDRICRAVGEKRTPSRCGILDVVEMMNSEHLAGLPAESRRCAVLMALEAMGAGIDNLLQDAVGRQRALNEYDKEQQEQLRSFEEARAEENRRLSGELESVTNQYMARVQANLDEVAQEQDRFRQWQQKKLRQTKCIAEAAAMCVPENATAPPTGLTAVLERATVARW